MVPAHIIVGDDDGRRFPIEAGQFVYGPYRFGQLGKCRRSVGKPIEAYREIVERFAQRVGQENIDDVHDRPESQVLFQCTCVTAFCDGVVTII